MHSLLDVFFLQQMLEYASKLSTTQAAWDHMQVMAPDLGFFASVYVCPLTETLDNVLKNRLDLVQAIESSRTWPTYLWRNKYDFRPLWMLLVWTSSIGSFFGGFCWSRTSPTLPVCRNWMDVAIVTQRLMASRSFDTRYDVSTFHQFLKELSICKQEYGMLYYFVWLSYCTPFFL